MEGIKEASTARHARTVAHELTDGAPCLGPVEI